MDIQAVMICPVTKASAEYFWSKLIVHNFTFFDIKSPDSYCNLWDESQSDFSASVFALIIIKFLEDKVPFVEGDEVTLWLDGCTYQNQNSIVSNTLLNFSIENKIVILQKYLENGHTQMKCDSMHSTIERNFKKKSIYLPSSYIMYCQSA